MKPYTPNFSPGVTAKFLAAATVATVATAGVFSPKVNAQPGIFSPSGLATSQIKDTILEDFKGFENAFGFKITEENLDEIRKAFTAENDEKGWELFKPLLVNKQELVTMKDNFENKFPIYNDQFDRYEMMENFFKDTL